jgi:exodeoxyribonuclease-3
MRIATWNVNSLPVRMPRVLEWLARVEPDVLCMQETKIADAAFPHAPLEELGYASVATETAATTASPSHREWASRT